LFTRWYENEAGLPAKAYALVSPSQASLLNGCTIADYSAKGHETSSQHGSRTAQDSNLIPYSCTDNFAIKSAVIAHLRFVDI